MHILYKKIVLLLSLLMFLSSCATAGSIPLPPMEIKIFEAPTRAPVTHPTAYRPVVPVPTATERVPISFVITSTPHAILHYPLWIDPSVPDALRQIASSWNLQMAEDPSTAVFKLTPAVQSDQNQATWIYALVAPFPTTTDEVSLEDIKDAWYASSTGPFTDSPLWMAESTREAFTSLWGEAGSGSVRTVAADKLVDALWQNQPSWGIVPFESLDPKLKVLIIDGQSPVHNDFNSLEYALKVPFALIGNKPVSIEMPTTNRDPSKLTVLLMTGVTALVRATAVRMEVVGIDYPAWNIADVLQAADITHISNEIPFYSGCPYPDSRQEGLVFCSRPKYIGLLDHIGTDVVELTGNHFQDYGSEATLATIEMYEQRHWPYYGGGKDLEDSHKPAFIEHNGNRFAFIGCNPAGPAFAWATKNKPGAAPCGDYAWIKEAITRLHTQGYIVIATFQYVEYYQPKPTPKHISDFRAIANAGATIVSGSQAHVPQAMEFYDNAFVHYGLGNLFFDQMSGESPHEFLDRHVFYDGRYISTELITAMLEDYARPRLMVPSEREQFLKTMFNVSGW